MKAGVDNFKPLTIDTVTADSTVITGSGEPNFLLAFAVNGKTIATGSVLSSGRYSITIPRQEAGAVIDGIEHDAHNINRMYITETIVQPGNMAKTTIDELTTDSNTVSGTGEPGGIITITNGFTTIASGVIQPDGSYQFPILPQPAGSTVVATVIADGKFETAFTIVKDNTIVQTTINGVTQLDTRVTGTGEPNGNIELRNGGTLIASGKVDINGNYDLPISKQSAGSVITATVTKLANGKTSSASTTVIANEVSAPVITAPTIYDVDTQVSGTSTADKIFVYNQSGLKIGEAIVVGGRFTIEFPKQQAGQTLYFTAVDKEGNHSDFTTRLVEKATIEITRAKKIGIVGNTEQLNVTTNPPGLPVVWTSSNPAVASVSTTGLVTYKSAGTATISATISSGTAATVQVDVSKVAGPEITTPVYDTTTEVTGTAPAPGKVNAYVDGEKIGSATVNPDGTFTVTFPEQGVGSVIEFKAETPNGYESDPTKETVKATTIKINEKITSGFVGKTETLTATTTPKDAKVTWSSSKSSVATVNTTTGVVTFKAAGTVDIIAKLANGKSAKVTITVIGTPEVTTPIYDLTTEVTGTGTPESTVVAYVDGEEIGRTVTDDDGDFTIIFPAQEAGSDIQFVAEDANGVSGNPSTVEVLASTIKINETGKTGFVGDTQQLTVTTTPVNQAATWKSSNVSVASVNSKTGLVTFKAVGSVTITATLKSGATATTTIKVTKKSIRHT
ncbi:Ig-like domain-containing protein [Listeria cornellensis]|uniref:BIG2 domain-containing protein n=1 Tax=Listeria cornellensis FSL F6-0969 TaxID=1265820 RepID=W7BDU7_9LIST|nr:Ig-like domain-containing protein [Listeria cornellensis]EUJ25284.1 hypothetical protein PCORN_18044 [Listeria cornellensis FSL F6-0969]